MRPLHALTLHPEWAWAIAYLPPELAKRVENRSWIPGRKNQQLQPGDWLAIHAGALGCSRFGGVWGKRLYQMILTCRKQERGTADKLWRVTIQHNDDLGHHGCLDGVPMREATSAIVALARVDYWDREQMTSWDVEGPWHWRLTDVRVLAEPVPCKGRQGLWRVPVPVLEDLLVACPWLAVGAP